MERIAAIVEGHTEAHFVHATYAASHIIRPIPNGETVPVEQIIEAILDAMDVIGGNISKILILLDREQREMEAEDFLSKIQSALELRCGTRKLYIGVADRQIENWIVADEQEMRNRYKPDFEYQGDGCGGKAVLEKINGGVSLGPFDTALLLKSCSANRASTRSSSLARLLKIIDFDWFWAKN
jgi:hypothetical protein